MTKFTIEAVRAHIRGKHPGCPEFAAEFFAAEAAGRVWNNCTIDKAVGISMQTFLRHNLTDYDQLLLEGVEREAAKRCVQPKVNAMISLWNKADRVPASGVAGFPSHR